MKRIKLILCLVCLVLMFSIIGCGTDNNTTVTSTTGTTSAIFKGTIVEIDNGAMLVRPDDGSAESATSDQFSIPIDYVDSSVEPAVGDSIEVVYSGVIEELYPALLKDITRISIIGNESVITEILD